MFFTTLLLGKARSDIMLGHFTTDVELFSGALKVWHQYIKSFVVSHLHYVISDQTCMEDMFSRYFKLSAYLMKISKRVVVQIPPHNTDVQLLSGKMKNMCILPYPKPQNCHSMYTDNYTSLKSEMSVTWTSGQLSYFNKYSRLLFDKETCVNYVWIFNLDANLRLNVTLNEVYFQSRYVDCTYAKLKIHRAFGNTKVPSSFALENNTWVWMVKKLEKYSHVYCGHCSSFSIYPLFHSIDIRVLIERSVPSFINASFAVMDNSIVWNTERTKSFQPKPDLVYRLKNGFSLVSYSIQVTKAEHVMLNTQILNSHRYVLYDGPGYSSNVVKNTANVVHNMSSFQCSVQIFMRTDCVYVQNLISYASIKLALSRTINLDHTSDIILDLPIAECCPQFCAVFLKAQNGYQVNATITKVSYKGFIENVTCKYGGLVATEQLIDDYRESVTLCQNHDGSSRLSRSLYSTNSSLTLVLYWYNHSSINASLTLSVTKCRAAN